MPPWFWSACPHLEGVCPVFLKNALHLHSPAIQQNSDDLLQQQSALTAHPLDSQYTTDVLRLILFFSLIIYFFFQLFKIFIRNIIMINNLNILKITFNYIKDNIIYFKSKNFTIVF